MRTYHGETITKAEAMYPMIENAMSNDVAFLFSQSARLKVGEREINLTDLIISHGM